uniref:non-specific serine/threonine protein kinase n=1 Tax=Oryza barthii TaxID=65489 RepID=A0A0D3FLR0_9ORYZ
MQAAAAAAAVELPPALFTNASSLEQLVLKSNPGLTGRIPATLSDLRSLRVLSLSQNGFRGEIPPELGRLAALQQLDLSYNNLTGEENPIGTAVPAAVVGSLRRLQVVGMSGLDGPIPASLAALPRLGRLNLSQNRLAGEIALPAEFVARLGRRLDVRGNDELCVDRGRYGGAQASYLGAPPCAAAGGGSGAAVGGTSSSPVESSAGAAATAGRGFRVYGIAGMFGGMVYHLLMLSLVFHFMIRCFNKFVKRPWFCNVYKFFI